MMAAEFGRDDDIVVLSDSEDEGRSFKRAKPSFASAATARSSSGPLVDDRWQGHDDIVFDDDLPPPPRHAESEDMEVDGPDYSSQPTFEAQEPDRASESATPDTPTQSTVPKGRLAGLTARVGVRPSDSPSSVARPKVVPQPEVIVLDSDDDEPEVYENGHQGTSYTQSDSQSDTQREYQHLYDQLNRANASEANHDNHDNPSNHPTQANHSSNHSNHPSNHPSNPHSHQLAYDPAGIYTHDDSPVPLYDSEDDLVELDSATVDRNKFKEVSFHSDDDYEDDPRHSHDPYRHKDEWDEHQAQLVEQARRDLASRIQGLQESRHQLGRGIAQWESESQDLRAFMADAKQRLAAEGVKMAQVLSAGMQADFTLATDLRHQISNSEQTLHHRQNLIRSSQNRMASMFAQMERCRVALAGPVSAMAREYQAGRGIFASMGALASGVAHQVHNMTAGTVYDANVGFKDDADLQSLLNNIRPEEESEEGMEPTPPEMNITLMKHQRIGLTWLVRMEKAQQRGGILADDMGLGKTIQAISLIVRNRPTEHECKTTLIIGPVSLLRQWAEEIRQKVRADKPLSMALFHGENKKKINSYQSMRQFDVVLTSYSTLQNEFKNHYKPELAQAAQDNRQNTWLPDTSGTVIDNRRRAYTSPFFGNAHKFYRIILDEAQAIKNKNTVASRAVASILASYRLCLSGTPMQNTIDELYPILRFLRVKPYSNEQRFRSDISNPIKQAGRGKYDSFDKNDAMQKLRAVLSAVLLRRTKDSKVDGQPILSLPPKHLKRLNVEMKPAEREYYASVEMKVQKTAKKLLGKKGRPGSDSILALLTRLRQACLHQYLIEVGELKRAYAAEDDSYIRQWMGEFPQLYDAIRGIDARHTGQILAALTPDMDDDDRDPVEMLLGQRHQSKDEVARLKDEEVAQLKGEVARLKDEEVAQLKDEEVASFLFDRSATDSPLEAKPEPKSEYDQLKAESDLTKAEDANSPYEVRDDKDAVPEEINDIQCRGCESFYTPHDDLLLAVPLCGHVLCGDCVQDAFTQADGNRGDCPGCSDVKFTRRDLVDVRVFDMVHRQRMGRDEFVSVCRRQFGSKKHMPTDTIINEVIESHDGKFDLSAKMEHCINHIKDIFTRYPEEKVIVFSQFTTLFDLIKRKFDDAGIAYLRYDGSMSIDAKNDTIKKFYQDPDRKVLMLSLKAGNVGLTLTCASHVIIIDPFWNPYVEDQAMDRAHRIGQTRPVHVHRMFVRDTVESRILELQEKKRELIGAAMDESGLKKVSKFSSREIGFLFGLNRLEE
ncbi:hypothetical protein DICA3_D15302 [Diutina catenulata]